MQTGSHHGAPSVRRRETSAIKNRGRGAPRVAFPAHWTSHFALFTLHFSLCTIRLESRAEERRINLPGLLGSISAGVGLKGLGQQGCDDDLELDLRSVADQHHPDLSRAVEEEG